jgi:hypothetical protein
MSGVFFGLAVLAFVLLYFGLQRKSALRSGTRFLLALLTILFGGVTGFCLYGAVAWSDRGGGVMLFFALPAGFITWLFAAGLFASAKHEGYYDKSVDEKIAFNIALADEIEATQRTRLAALMKERERFWLTGKRRTEIDAEMNAIREQMKHMDKLRAAVQRPEIYQGDEK